MFFSYIIKNYTFIFRYIMYWQLTFSVKRNIFGAWWTLAMWLSAKGDVCPHEHTGAEPVYRDILGGDVENHIVCSKI